MPRTTLDVSGAAIPVCGYARVSTGLQAESGAGMDAQRAAIRRECEHRGWELVEVFEDAGASGRSVNGRPGLHAALSALDSRHAELLVVAKVDRLSRSVGDFSRLLERYPKRLHVLDLGIDLASPYGEMVATVVSAMARLEARLVSERTSAALAARREAGVVLGRPRRMAPQTVQRIHDLRSDGLTLAGIADRLNAETVRTPTGQGRWSTSGVRRALRYAAA